jgi:endogenous inhibitor of DNA gyrase (YacG/DUF329 family)
MASKLQVKCPNCKKEFEYYSSDFRPFCSERCRLIDLGQWLDGTFAVPAQNLSEEEKNQLQQLVEETLDPDEEQ